MPNQTGILGSLLPIESGEHHSTFAAQQSDDDAEGSVTTKSAAGDIPGVSPAVKSLLLKLGSALTSVKGLQDIEFLGSIYTKWPLENTTKIEVQAPKEMTLSAGQLAFAAAFQHANLSRKEYKAIFEALEQVALVEELRGLPDYADTLRHRFLGSLPLLASDERPSPSTRKRSSLERPTRRISLCLTLSP
ncbi:hypothetical protein E4U56_005071 [Claviceps arundinis]|uniref:Uncharacterized protein n=1 Tax=Claviceps arundinis TaxID=1623583 RepID=A0A9P7MM96_9HYPO|nr:hypothetical protein E4U56_005071 [Claviceps arundinis]